MKYQKGGCLLTRKEVIRVLIFSKENRTVCNACWDIKKKKRSSQMKEVPYNLSAGCLNAKFRWCCNYING